MDAEIQAGAATYDQHAVQGQAFIRKVWNRVPQETRDLLQSNGYDKMGVARRGSDQITSPYVSEIESLEYSLGVLHKAATSKPPAKKTDEIPRILYNNEVLIEAGIFRDRRWRNSEFAALAIHAVIKKQVTSSLELLYLKGGKTEFQSVSAWLSIGKLIAIVAFAIGLPFAIGNGLAAASTGDGGSATAYAFFAFFAVGFFLDLNEKNKPGAAHTPELLAYEKWNSMLNSEFHIGTGHGLQIKLADMVRQGVNVPSVLFDLCAVLQRD